MNAQNVSTGKPTGGAISTAPLNTPLPLDAVTDLTGFESLGYISDAGLVNSNTPANTDIKAWGGQTVLSVQSEKPDTFKFTLIEVMNKVVLRAVYNDNNVTEIEVQDNETDKHTEIKISANADEPEYKSYVIDMIMKAGALKRIVIPAAKVTSISDISYTDSGAVGYEITITAVPDTAGNTHYEYIKTVQ